MLKTRLPPTQRVASPKPAVTLLYATSANFAMPANFGKRVGMRSRNRKSRWSGAGAMLECEGARSVSESGWRAATKDPVTVDRLRRLSTSCRRKFPSKRKGDLSLGKGPETARDLSP
ncbi:hypothetical protein M758_1G035400 [Ceratodon purpureus]|nr:hypothetical protein M758_1G035400 [Ceratodon purpureus]